MRPGMAFALALAATGASACVRSNSVECGDNGELVCAEGLLCRVVQGQDLCVTPDQIEACEAGTCGADSDPPTAVCHDGVCFAIECGNRLVDPGEVCDDGNDAYEDGCSLSCRSNERCGNAVVDLVLGESCDDGNAFSHDGCTPTCEREIARWLVTTVAGAPPGRVGHAAAYDAARGRVMMFGGSDDKGGTTDYGDLWESERAGWSQVIRTPSPGPRTEHAMAYDPVRRRTVLFGGGGVAINGAPDQVWEWDGSDWTAVPLQTPRPAPRQGHAMAYVPSRRAIVLVGGDCGAGPCDDAWEWNGAAWTKIESTPAPGGLIDASFTTDARRGIGVLAATLAAGPVETWELDATGWTDRTDRSQPERALPRNAQIAWDPSSQRVIAYGSSTAVDDQGTRSWDGNQWTRLPNATEPGQRHSHAMATHGALGRVVLVGGRRGNPAAAGCLTCDIYEDAWQWNGTAWEPSSLQPDPRAFTSVAYDPVRDRALFLGGVANGNQTLEWWQLDARSTWTELQPPAWRMPRSGTSLVWDVAHDAAIGFGGLEGPELQDDTYRWTDGGGWEVVETGTRPSARYAAMLSYDAARGTVLLFGGFALDDAGMPVSLADLWEWDGASWTQLPATGPRGRAGGVFAYDRVQGHHVLMGGETLGLVLSDTWIFDGASWTRMPSIIPPRTGAAMAWDAARRALVLHGGLSIAVRALGDTWEWTADGWRTVPTFDAPAARGGHVAWTARDGGIYTYGGAPDLSFSSFFNERNRLRFATEALPETCSLETDTDGDSLAGCADPDCWGTCSPLCSPGVECPAGAPGCGDGTCTEPLESCEICPRDCGECPVVCGDGSCTPGEACPGDCDA